MEIVLKTPKEFLEEEYGIILSDEKSLIHPDMLCKIMIEYSKHVSSANYNFPQGFVISFFPTTTQRSGSATLLIHPNDVPNKEILNTDKDHE